MNKEDPIYEAIKKYTDLEYEIKDSVKTITIAFKKTDKKTVDEFREKLEQELLKFTKGGLVYLLP